MNSGNYRQEEKKILDQILDREVYDARMRPNGYNASDGPTIVNVNLYFRSFEKIDDVKMVRFLIKQQNPTDQRDIDIVYIVLTPHENGDQPSTKSYLNFDGPYAQA